MRNILLMTMLFSFSQRGFSQKPVVDTSVFNKWPIFKSASVSTDGRSVFYYIEHPTQRNYLLIVQDIQTGWKTEITDVWVNTVAIFRVSDVSFITSRQNFAKAAIEGYTLTPFS